MSAAAPLLEVRDLCTHFFTFEGVRGPLTGFRIVSKKARRWALSVSRVRQERYRLLHHAHCSRAARQDRGRLHIFDDLDLVKLSQKKMRRIRGNRIAMIFQEPMTSLNPVYTIGDQIGEMFRLHKKMSRGDARDAAEEMLTRVQIPAPRRRLDEYPHQLSGGMRQRAMIAMALACDPELLIADEPTTALDVTVQAQILDLMLKLRDEFDTSIQIITHDLGVIAEISEKVVVMYAGRVVEQADTASLFSNPLHPYTHGLLNSIPVLGSRGDSGRQKLEEIKGMVPSLYEIGTGCAFRPRCTHAMEICAAQLPPLAPVEGTHSVRCWLHIDDKQDG